VSSFNGAHIPPGWQSIPIRALGSMRAGVAITAESIEETGDYPVYGAHGLRGYTEDFTHDGTYLLIGRQGALCGNVGLAQGKFWASEHAIVMTPGQDFDPRWLRYTLQWADLGRLSTSAAQPGISVGVIGQVRVPVPSAPVRLAIADFLDRETAQIDAMIEAQHKVVAHLAERQNAALREQLVGQCQHLEPRRLGRHLRKLSRAVPADAGVVTAYRDGVVTLRELRREDGYTFSDKEDGYQGVWRGDLVFHALDGFAGAVGVALESGKCSPVYHVCRPEEDDGPQYFALLLRALGQTGLLEAYAWSVRQRSVDYRTWDLFASIPVHCPDRGEQGRIVAEYMQSCSRTEQLIEAAEATVAVIRERRAALIAAAVTGSVDIISGTEHVDSRQELAATS
jgi:type I restriction enzyme, S subunit